MRLRQTISRSTPWIRNRERRNSRRRRFASRSAWRTPVDLHLTEDKASPEEEAAVDAALEKLASSDRKSTRLNSSHTVISYAVFCLKKKKQNIIITND